MRDHVRDLSSVRSATDRLLATAARLDDAALAAPSLLPGWSRGHVLAHLARNADALVNVLSGRPMYADDASRDTDIEQGAVRPVAVQLADLRESAGRFAAVCGTPADWSRTVELRGGVTDSADRVPLRRLVEVALHHVDLGAGPALADLPDDVTREVIGYLAARYESRGDVPAAVLTGDGGRTWHTGGAAGGDRVTVTGPDTHLLGWLSGREDGADLQVTGGALPVLPAL